mmetsp:Transcript_14770/g.20008  ORF Transcript_14770/g.20008 Transcript_14770/m.20008 type:complete len:122 (-) Transcript_14770:372-737(-)
MALQLLYVKLRTLVFLHGLTSLRALREDVLGAVTSLSQLLRQQEYFILVLVVVLGLSAIHDLTFSHLIPRRAFFLMPILVGVWVVDILEMVLLFLVVFDRFRDLSVWHWVGLVVVKIVAIR